MLTVPQALAVYDDRLIRLLLHLVLIGSFVLAIVSIVLRRQKVLGFSAISLVFVAVAFGGSHTQSRTDLNSDVYLGLDWFLLSLVLTGIVFIPIERLLGNREQPIFRYEWREDLLYFLISSTIRAGADILFLDAGRDDPASHRFGRLPSGTWGANRSCVQFLEITLLTDLVQYWVHRCFHRVPGCGNFTPCITRPRRWTGWPARECTWSRSFSSAA